MDPHKILITVINWNNYSLTDECIESILQNDYEHYKIVIIDNASINDSFSKLKAKHATNSKIKLLKLDENLGFAGGHLAAIQSEDITSYSAVWLLNNDLTIKENALSQLLAYHSEHPDDVLGSLILTKDNRVSFAGVPMDSPDLHHNIYSRFIDEPYDEVKHQLKTEPVNGLNGASYFIPVKIYKELGFIPTHYFLYYEEEDYNFTLRSKGIRTILIHDSMVHHNVGYSSDMGKRIPCILNYYKVRNSMYYAKKVFGYSRRKSLRDAWGFLPFIKSLYYRTRSYFAPKNLDLFNKYMKHFGVYHFYIAKRGKVFDPNDYIA